MQAGSLVATTSSPPIQSTRGLTVGGWKASVDRQMSLDCSLVSISGSFSQNTNSAVGSAWQVSQGMPTSSPTCTPWTPAPPRSPRQRTQSPMRRLTGAQPSSGKVVAREPAEDPALDLKQVRDACVDLKDRIARQQSTDFAFRMPFFSMPSTQSRQGQTPKRSSSPPSRTTASPQRVRKATVLSQDNDEGVPEAASDRLLATSQRSLAVCRSPCARLVSTWQQQSQQPSASPRHRPQSPSRWLPAQPALAPTVPVAMDIEDVSNRGSKVFPSTLQRLGEDKIATAPWPMSKSSVAVKKADDEVSADPSQGTRLSSVSVTQRQPRIARKASPAQRARTLSPTRVASVAAVGSTLAVKSVAKDIDDVRSKAPRPSTSALSPERAGPGDQLPAPKPRASPVSVASSAVPTKDVPELSAKCPRSSGSAAVLNKDENEAREGLRRPGPSSSTTLATATTQKEVGVLEPVETGVFPSEEDLKPWLEAAANFKLNTDFDVTCPTEKLDFAALMATMKKESAGKWTIQTMADKLLLNGLLENLGLPHMPMIFASRSLAKLRERLEVLVDKLIIATAKNQPYDIIVKPTHLSSAQGVMSFNKVHSSHREDTIRQLEQHMRKYIETQASKQESAALQSLKPGYIGQPKYKSVVGFKAPLELKVCALWGKARAGVWWWGTRAAGPAQVPHRNVWIVRSPNVPGELNDDDGWEVLHNHPGGNAGWDQAVLLFKRHMPEMAALTEALATALGTPFLRADFFVGSPKWGVRLNEVAYGCGLEYRNLLKDGDNQRIIDDKPTMSEILRQGMALCHRRLPPHHFLQMLGAQGSCYEETSIIPLPSPLTNFSSTLNTQPDLQLADYAVEDHLCKTHKDMPPSEKEAEHAREKPSEPVPIGFRGAAVVKPAALVKPHNGHIPTLVMPRSVAVIPTAPAVVLSEPPRPSVVVQPHMPTVPLKARLEAPVTSTCARVSTQPAARPSIVLRAGGLR